MPVAVVPFSIEHHLTDAVDVLLRVRAADRNYPPQQDAARTRDAFTAWLLDDNPIGRWAALLDGRVVGHIQLTTAHDYLVEFFAAEHFMPQQGCGFAEVSKLFADPLRANEGIGSALLETARLAAWDICNCNPYWR